MRNRRVFGPVRTLLVASILTSWQSSFAANPLQIQTVAEKSDYHATARSAEVATFVDRVAATAPHITRIQFGKTGEDRPMIAAIVAQPPVTGPQDLEHDNRLPVLLIGGIHPGECAGKEALLALLRELGNQPDHAWLRQLVLVIVPNFNADGNDRVGKHHRPHQIGPSAGMGIRQNAQGLDLNRDWMKLETPEDRAMVRLIDRWNPYLFIDAHTTNGSFHQYWLTYDVPHNPASPAPVRRLLRDDMLPQVTTRLAQTGIKTFYYGNFNTEHTKWTTYGYEPRYSTEYVGLRGRLAILAEAHAYVSYEQRIRATHDFVSASVDFVAQNAQHVKQTVDSAALATTRSGHNNAANDRVPLRSTLAPLDQPVTIRGYTRETERTTKRPKDYEVEFVGIATPSLSVTRPCAYLLPESSSRVADRLRMHGVKVERLARDTQLPVESYYITSVQRAAQPYQGHRAVRVETRVERAARLIKRGTLIVRTAQPLGNLVIHLLEPQAVDSLLTWNFFDPALAKGWECPVQRLAKTVPLVTEPVDRIIPAQRLSLEDIYGPKRATLVRKITPPRWLPNEDRYVAEFGGRSVTMDAETGAMSAAPRVDASKLSEALAKLPNISPAEAKQIASQKNRRNPGGEGVLVDWQDDLYYWAPEQPATRLTNSKPRERFVTFSPDGKRIGFVRDYNLYVVQLATGRETALTHDGSADLLFGQLDWVYQEELYGRGHYRAYWWSPDSKWLALLRLDETPVPKFTVTDNLPYHQKLEQNRYPLAGDALPKVTVGIVEANGGDVRWVTHDDYDEPELLISRVDWSPDSRAIYYQVQDRAQRWLDYRRCPVTSAVSRRVLRETTMAWVSVFGPPKWLPDKSSLWLSERSGHKHIYRVSADGKQVSPVTSGTWDVDKIVDIDPGNGLVYFSAFKDAPTSNRVYSIHWDGSNSKCITPSGGTHAVTFSPSKEYFLDTFSNIDQPRRSNLYRADGSFVRSVDPNLDDRLKYYNLGSVDRVSVPTRAGVTLSGMLIRPANFDRTKKYPVLCYVYGGPQSPTVRDRWGGTTYLWHQLLAQHGYAIWLCDCRSSSTLGAKHAWSCYRDLGSAELRDIEAGLEWLTRQSWVDANRIGIWGWSYGGFMTSYALTHSSRFRVGIAGAPVTDWCNYDAIYTERYMDIPKRNQAGYQSSSVVAAADKLHGKLLLLHGTIDDNVHIANSMQFVYALQNAGKQFQLMVYPKNRHGVTGSSQVQHLRALMTHFILDNL